MGSKKLNNESMLVASELMQVSLDLSTYRRTLALALGNLIIIIIIGCSIVLFETLIGASLPLIFFCLIISFAAVFLHIYVFRHVFRELRLGKSVLIYPIVILLGYTINSLLSILLPINFVWYPLLGISNLLMGVAVENSLYKNNSILSRPLLVSGLGLLLTSPLVFMFILQFQEINTFIISSIALILVSLTTSYSMAEAEKRVVAK